MKYFICFKLLKSSHETCKRDKLNDCGEKPFNDSYIASIAAPYFGNAWNLVI